MNVSGSSAAWLRPAVYCLLFLMLPLWSSARSIPDTTVAYRIDSADVKTIDGIVKAMLDVISGEPGPRNWNRLRSLCLPSAQFNALVPGRDGKPRFFAGTIDGYIKSTTPILMKQAFYEKELHRVIEEFGGIAHVFSTYESRLSKSGEVFERGINSIQLVYDKNRWWVVNVMWCGETKDHPLPAKYLGK